MVSSSTLSKSLAGVHNFLPTPFLENYDLDFYGARENVAYHAKSCPDYMIVTVCGGFGEGLSLNVEEHKDLIVAAVDGANGVLPVTAVALGEYGLQKRMVRNAEEAGASSVRVRFPPSQVTSFEVAYSYIRELAESVQIEMVIFATGEHSFWPDVFARLAGISNIVGFSPPGDADFSNHVGVKIQHMLPGRYVWINENEDSAMKSFKNGCQGYTTAVASLIPKSSRQFWKYGMSGDTKNMIHTYETLIKPIRDIREIGPGCEIGSIKFALEVLGRSGGPTRPPASPVSSFDKDKIINILKQHPEISDMLV